MLAITNSGAKHSGSNEDVSWSGTTHFVRDPPLRHDHDIGSTRRRTSSMVAAATVAQGMANRLDVEKERQREAQLATTPGIREQWYSRLPHERVRCRT
jgi:hypothetical protein